jgi:hypothetical protein
VSWLRSARSKITFAVGSHDSIRIMDPSGLSGCATSRETVAPAGLVSEDEQQPVLMRHLVLQRQDEPSRKVSGIRDRRSRRRIAFNSGLMISVVIRTGLLRTRARPAEAAAHIDSRTVSSARTRAPASAFLIGCVTAESPADDGLAPTRILRGAESELREAKPSKCPPQSAAVHSQGARRVRPIPAVRFQDRHQASGLVR